MPELTLSMDNLARLDNGKVHAAFDHEIRQAIRDVLDRPGDKAARKVTLQITAVPKLTEDDATLDTILVTFRVSSATPVRRSIEYPMLPTGAGALMFQELSPRDPRQPGLPFANTVQADPVEPETAEEVDHRDEEVLDGD